MKIQELFKMFEDKKFWIMAFDILFIISPGFLLLFVFQEGLFRELDTLKLVILSISITGPLYVINILLGAFFSKNKKIHFENYSFAILMSGYIFYLSFFAYYIINNFVLKISFFWFISLLLFIETLHLYEIYKENKPIR
jgi:hypothetical protein